MLINWHMGVEQQATSGEHCFTTTEPCVWLVIIMGWDNNIVLHALKKVLSMPWDIIYCLPGCLQQEPINAVGIKLCRAPLGQDFDWFWIILDCIGQIWTIMSIWARLIWPVYFNPSILTCLFWPVYLDLSICTCFCGPIYLVLFILSFWTPLFRLVYLDLSVRIRLFIPVNLDLFI